MKRKMSTNNFNLIRNRWFLLLLLLTPNALLVAQTEGDLPEWVQAMYQEMNAEEPKIAKVIGLYESYYDRHPFEKNKHTWRFKMWVRNPESYIPDLDTYLREQDIARNSYVQRRLEQKYSSRSISNCPWQAIGPIQNHHPNGSVMDQLTHISSVTSAPSNPSIMYCGTEGGEVYKSIDAGDSWFCVSYGPELVMSQWGGVTAMAVHPTNPDIVYVAGEGNFYKSVNGGLNWIELNVVLSGGTGEAHSMLIHPLNPNIVFWATTSGVFRSNDAGATITSAHNQWTYDIDMHPNNPDSLFIVTRNQATINPEFYISTDAGLTWSQQTNGWYASSAPDRRLMSAKIAVAPSDPSVIYTVLLGDSTASDDGLIGLMKSIDGGSSWFMPVGYCGDPYTANHINYSGWSAEFMCEMVVSDTNPDHLIVGTVSTYKSTDGGQTFNALSWGDPQKDLHDDVRDIYQDGNRLWIATDGGLNLSTDFYTNNVSRKTYGLHGQDFWGFDIGWHEDVMVGGLFHNGFNVYHENYPARNTINYGGGEPPTGYVNPSDAKRFYRMQDVILMPDAIGQPFTFLFQIAHRPYEAPWPAYSSRIAFHPNSYNTFYLGADSKLWKTTDGGFNMSLVKDFYTPTSTADSLNKVNEIQISDKNPAVIYITRTFNGISTTPELWKTTDEGQTWTQLNLPVSPIGSRALITLDPLNDDNIWLGFAAASPAMGYIQNSLNGNKVYRSTDGGQTWINLTTITLDGEECYDIIHVAGSNGGVYVCSQNSVYYRDNSMTDWDIQDNNLPFYISTNIGKIWYKEEKLRIGTYGRGVWEKDLCDSTRAPIARIMVNTLEQNIVNSNCYGLDIDSLYFDDYSYMAYEDSATNTWAWQFPTGSPSASSLRNPAVHFNTVGTHQAILTITDKYGMQDTDTLEVSINSIPISSLVQEDFELGIPSEIEVINYDLAETWKLSPNNAGGYGTSNFSILMDNYNYDQSGEYDDFRFGFDLSSGTNPWMTFDVAYAPYSSTLGDSLEVLVSTDCGITFQKPYAKAPADLATVPIGTTYPDSNTWRTDSVDLSPYIGTQELIVIFRNINGYGNLLYIDNINISNPNITSLDDISITVDHFILYPNPINSGSELYYRKSDKKNFRFTLYSTEGKQVSNQWINGQVINLPDGLPAGIYYYRAEQEDKIFNGKIIIN
jgi:hypothetical protein